MSLVLAAPAAPDDGEAAYAAAWADTLATAQIGDLVALPTPQGTQAGVVVAQHGAETEIQFRGSRPTRTYRRPADTACHNYGPAAADWETPSHWCLYNSSPDYRATCDASHYLRIRQQQS